MSSEKWRPSCLGLNVLMKWAPVDNVTLLYLYGYAGSKINIAHGYDVLMHPGVLYLYTGVYYISAAQDRLALRK